MRIRRRAASTGDSLRVFFCSDVHGSDRCWKKFLSAAKVHRVDALLMGGDLTGKAVIPIVDRGGSWFYDFGGKTERIESRAELERVQRMLRDRGLYTWVAEPDEAADLQRPDRQDRIYEELVLESFARWIDLAEERLAGSDIACLVLPGNDDIFGIDELLAQSSLLVNPDCSVVPVGDGFQVMAVGHSNPTPWDTPRELSEEELGARLAGLRSDLDAERRTILIAHVPPYGSSLDNAPKLLERDGELAVDRSGGEPAMVPVGSTAVRDFIESEQPLVSLHGHVHESRGVARIGQTVCINPGSEYSTGDLCGAIVELSKVSVRQCQLVTG